MTRLEVAVVGVGPRGLSVLERLCANERADPRHDAVVVHVVDPAAPGAGAVWRTDQSRYLLMNTVASQITLYTDESSRIDGPVEPGPSLWEWASSLREHDEHTLAEAAGLGPNSYPTRAFYGAYLNDCFRRIVANAPGHVRFEVHRSQAVAMADTHGVLGGPQGIRLADGTRLNRLDAIVLAQGHVSAHLTPQQERTASLARIHHLTYLTPANPAEVDLSGIAAGEPVLLRGLGLNFFDYMALLTAGRGGRFRRTGDGLTYEPSGREPVLYASSRRGVPYHARGENEKRAFGRYFPRLLTPARVAELRARPLRFAEDVWPLIAREVECVYYETLLSRQHRDADGFGAAYLADPAAALDAYEVVERFDWESLTRPHRGRSFASRAEFTEWLLSYLRNDVRHAREGNVRGPLKAALDVLRDLRNEVRLAVDHGGLDGSSHRDDLDGWYTPLNAYLSIGPPVSRIEEMIALVEAGVLVLTGPGTQIRLDTTEPTFVAASTEVPGPPVRSRVLIEARLPEPNLRRTVDPLLRHLLATDQVAPYRIPGANGTVYETGGLAVTERPYHLLDGRGRSHPRRFAYGVPTEAVHWATAAGIRPGVDSVTLADSDAIARAVLSLPALTSVPPEVRPTATETDLTGVIV
ncbi:FAD/NAD(P)-binding protein [Actinophytocola sp.]|uniref:FAD/NAD(P)-binding protein n=1 Tax=Actinophytocola sp. TaxID=1872138 RepID=UPI00389A576E